MLIETSNTLSVWSLKSPLPKSPSGMRVFCAFHPTRAGVPFRTGALGGFPETLAKGLKRSDCARGGRPPFDAMMMFTVLVLQALYSLSDDQAEFQIHDRLSFMR